MAIKGFLVEGKSVGSVLKQVRGEEFMNNNTCPRFGILFGRNFRNGSFLTWLCVCETSHLRTQGKPDVDVQNARLDQNLNCKRKRSSSGSYLVYKKGLYFCIISVSCPNLNN